MSLATEHPCRTVAFDLQRHLNTVLNGTGFRFVRDDTIREVHRSLAEVEARLGTDREQPGDLQMARDLAHALRGHLSARMLAEELADSGPGSLTAGAA